MNSTPATVPANATHIAVPAPPISAGKETGFNKKHLYAAIALVLSGVILGTILWFHGYVAWALARPPIDPLTSNPLLAASLPYNDVQFPSLNGKTAVDGWYIPAPEPTGQTVVFSHGYGGNREEIWVPLYDLAAALYQQNYNVLMFDYGFVKPSQIVTGGIQESQELLGAIQFAKQMGAEHIYIWGFSMGAGTALQTALQEPSIRGMILDSTFILSPDTLYHNIRQLVKLPKFPSLALIRLFFPLINGTSMNEIPYKAVLNEQYAMPIFLIHSEEDNKAPYQLAQDVYANQQAHPLSQLWLLPHERHELIYREHPEQYLDLTLSFLQALSPDTILAAAGQN